MTWRIGDAVESPREETLALTCSACDATIPNEAVNLDLLLADCPACHHIQAIGTVDANPPAGKPKAAPTELTIPQGVDVASGPNELVISYAWWNLRYVFQLVFCLFWNGFMVMWFSINLASGNYPFVAFGLIHASVGLWLLYSGVAGLLNRTTITATDGSLTVAHGPVPWRGGRTLGRDELSQLYCVQHVTHGKNGTHVTWSVDAVDRNERSVSLLTGIVDRQQALFFEKRVERYLGIVDRPIAGEA